MDAESSFPGLVVIVPVRNEAGNVPGLLQMSAALACRVLFVDHASTDSTGELLRSGGAEVVRCAEAGGFGRAVKYGISAVAGPAAPGYLAWLPGNLKTDPADALRLAVELHASRPYGSAYVKARRTGRSLKERVPSAIAGALLSIRGRGPYFEVGGTPTIVPSSLLEQVLEGPDGIEFETFTVFAMRQAGLELLRPPAPFGRRVHGASHWNKGLRSQLALLYRLLRYVTELRKNPRIPV
jgi:hypothetical protein